MSYTLPPLPYAYDALEPTISKQIMELHHKKHHQAYINNLNAASEKQAKATTPGEQIALQAAIKFNGGGHINHSLFWKNLAPSNENGGKLNPNSQLAAAINKQWGSLGAFQEQFVATTAGIQGSGWGWLVYNTSTKIFEIATTPNQDPILSPLVPLIGVDVWEHAFYLQYFNDKVFYLKEIWKVINWDEAENRLRAISSKL